MNFLFKGVETVSDYFACILTIAHKMRFHSETMIDVTVIKKILRSMISKIPRSMTTFLSGFR
jgi:hypothetical protein